jgi:hypothetical protein
LRRSWGFIRGRFSAVDAETARFDGLNAVGTSGRLRGRRRPQLVAHRIGRAVAERLMRAPRIVEREVAQVSIPRSDSSAASV